MQDSCNIMRYISNKLISKLIFLKNLAFQKSLIVKIDADKMLLII